MTVTAEHGPGWAHEPDPGRRVTAAGRMLAVLDAFGPRHRSLTLSDIARRAGLSLSTAHRLVHELVAWGALERDGEGRYSVGLRLLELSALAPRGLGLREAAHPHLEDLHRATHGNVQLGVRDGTGVVYVEAIRARVRNPVNSRSGTAGRCTPPAPVWCCSRTPNRSSRNRCSARRWNASAR